MSMVRSFARAVPLAAVFAAAIALGGSAFAQGVGRVDFTLGSKHLTSDWALGAPEVPAANDTLPPGSQSQPGMGVEITWAARGWPVSLALDVLHTYDDGFERLPPVNLGFDVNNQPHEIRASDVRRRASTLELGVGLRRSIVWHSWEPYLGGGGSWVHATIVHDVIDPALGTNGTLISRETGHDSAFGYWFGGGLLKHFGPRFHLGLTARTSSAKVTLPDHRVVGEEPYYRFTGTTSKVDAGGRNVAVIVGWDFPGR